MNSASARASSVLPTPVGPEEHEGAERTIGILQAGARAADGVGHRVDRFVLADDAAVQPLFHVNQLLHFAFHHPAHRDVGPLAHDLGDVFLVDFLFEHPVALLDVGQLRFGGADALLELGHAAVLELGRPGVVARALRVLDLAAERFLFLFQLARLLDQILLLLPVTGELPSRFLEIGELLLEFAEPLLRRLVALLAKGLALDFELHDAALELIELRRHRVDLHAKLRRGFVHQIDRLVGQESIGDVTVRQHGGRHERGVLELHPVVELVALAQASQDADGVLDRRLADHHGLESPFERGVLLDVFAVLVERRGADGVQLTPGQHRLQHVGRVHRPFGCAGADHRVQLVDEEDDLSLRVGDLLQHGFQPLLELAAVLGSGNQRPHVERDDAFVLEAFGNIAAFDAARETLDDRGLADAGFSDEHGIVLRAAGENLDDAANLLVTADDRVELLLARHPGQIAPVLLQRLVRALRVLAGHALRSADARERRQDRVARDACLLEQLRRG